MRRRGRAIHLDINQIAGPGPSLESLRQMLLERKRKILAKYETEGHPLYSTARLWDDGILDPRQTRAALALSLSASLNAPIPDWKAPVFRM